MHGNMILAALPIFTGGYAAILDRRRPARAWLRAARWRCSARRRWSRSAPTTAAGRPRPRRRRAGRCSRRSWSRSATWPGARLGQGGYRALAATYWGVIIGAVLVVPVLAGTIASNGLPDAAHQVVGRGRLHGRGDVDRRLHRLVLGARARRHPADRDDPVPAAVLRSAARRLAARRAVHAAAGRSRRSRSWRASRSRRTALGPIRVRSRSWNGSASTVRSHSSPAPAARPASASRPAGCSAELGAVVTIAATTDRIGDRQRELAAEGLTVDTGIADLTSFEAAQALAAEVAGRHGRIDVLVNNAGMVQTGVEAESRTLATMAEADWDLDIALNLKTCFAMTRAVVPGMIERRLRAGSSTSRASPGRWSRPRRRPATRPARPASTG